MDRNSLFHARFPTFVAAAMATVLGGAAAYPAENGAVWSMVWNGTAVPLSPTMEQADGDPRFYGTGSGVYFELTSPGGGEDAAELHRSVKLMVRMPHGRTPSSVKLSVDLNGNFGKATALNSGKPIALHGTVSLPATRVGGVDQVGIELHDVAGKTWGWVSGPVRP